MRFFEDGQSRPIQAPSAIFRCRSLLDAARQQIELVLKVFWGIHVVEMPKSGGRRLSSRPPLLK